MHEERAPTGRSPMKPPLLTKPSLGSSQAESERLSCHSKHLETKAAIGILDLGVERACVILVQSHVSRVWQSVAAVAASPVLCGSCDPGTLSPQV